MKPNLQKLAEKIKDNIRKEFEEVHLSKNLMDTISVYATEKGFDIDIPAEIYDLDKYFKEGVIIHTGEGSYAEAVNKTGGWSKTHMGYVEFAIKKAILDWITENEYRLKEYEEI